MLYTGIRQCLFYTGLGNDVHIEVLSYVREVLPYAREVLPYVREVLSYAREVLSYV